MSIRTQHGNFHYRFMLRGKKYFGVCEGCTNKKSAEKYEKDLINTQRRLLAQNSVKALIENFKEELSGGTQIPIAEAFDLSLKKPQKRMAGEKQIEHKRTYWRDYAAFMQANYPAITHLSQVTKKHAEEYIQHLRTHGRFDKTVSQRGKKDYTREFLLSPRTLNVMHERVAGVFSLLADDAGLAENPFLKVPKLKKSGETREAFSEEELRLIFAKAAAENPFVYGLFAVGVSTGMREGDICTLRWREVDLAEGFIKRVTLKTGKGVEVPILPPLREFLMQQKQKSGGDEYVLPEHAQMYRDNPDGISWRVKGFLEKVVVGTRVSDDGTTEEITMQTTKMTKGGRAVSIRDVHSLRHTFAYLAGVYGVPLPIVKDILGHLSPEMTARYQAHADRTTKARTMERIPSFISTRQLPPSEEIAAVPLSVKTSDDRLSELREYLKTAKDLRRDAIMRIIGD